jgi:glycine cleavage system T protein
MNEETESIIARESPLDDTHSRVDALMKEHHGWSVPQSFGDELFEYAAVRERGAGLMDLSSRGRFLVSGSEAVQFLNGLITNDMKTLDQNRWMPAAFPNVQGRLIASVRVVRYKDDLTDKKQGPTFLLDTEATTHANLLKTIERFTLAGDFRVADITTATALLSVQGRRAAEIVRSVLGSAAAEVPRGGVAQIDWQQEQVTILRATHTGEDGFDLVIKAEQASTLWDALASAGAQPVGDNAQNILRIEAGIPHYGKDMDETNVVTEAGLDDSVSYTKGCYIGQEIIARIKYRGHVAKKLSGLIFEQAAKLEEGVKIKSLDDKEIGRLTSATYSPHLGRTIALGYVKYDYLTPGTEVKLISADGELAARVATLPFVRGSWNEPA